MKLIDERIREEVDKAAKTHGFTIAPESEVVWPSHLVCP